MPSAPAIGAVPGVAGVHDLHVWSVAGDDASLTAHIAIASGLDIQTGGSQGSGRTPKHNSGYIISTLPTEPSGYDKALHA